MSKGKLCGRVAVAASAGVVAMAGVGAAVAAQGAQAATLPPTLQALEQKMTQLQVSTEAFTTQYQFGVPLSGKSHAAFSYGFTGEAQLGSELKANLTLHAGPRTSQERLFGETLYVLEPWIARYKHGRQWVRIPKEPLSQVIGFNPTETTSAGKGGGPLGTFAKLLGIVNNSQSVTDTGPATVDNQATTGFLVHFDPKELLGVFTEEQLNDLQFIGKPSVELEVFIAANGLPVHTVLKLEVSGIAATASVDITGINAPVAVTMPSANQTISKAARHKLLKRKGVKVMSVSGPKLP
ncbi:MAG: hypothetical protein FWD42_08925 [Solirubrobacterales bacterium]|nr:hypothetical protein [Solirubrobacterales bacterium]